MDSLPRSYKKQACRACHARKARCYAAHPLAMTCTRCASRNLVCDFPPPRKRGPKPLAKLPQAPNPAVFALSLFDIYFHHSMFPILPVVQPQALHKRFQAQTLPSHLLSSLLLLSLRMLKFPGDLTALQTHVVHTIQREEVSEDNLRAHLLYAMSCGFARDGQAMCMAVGTPTRMAHALNLHRIDAVPHTKHSAELEAKRRLWWCCFLFDRTASIFSGFRVQIDIRDICVRYPNELNTSVFSTASPMFDAMELYANPQVYEASHAPLLNKTVNLLIQLLAIAQDVYEFLTYSHVNCSCSRCVQLGSRRNASLQCTFIQLSEALRLWHAAFSKVNAACKVNGHPGLINLEALYSTLYILLSRTQLVCILSSNSSKASSAVIQELQLHYYRGVLDAAKQIVHSSKHTGGTIGFPCMPFYVLTAAHLFVDVIISHAVPEHDKRTATDYLTYCRTFLKTEADHFPHNCYKVTGERNQSELLEHAVTRKLS